MDDKTRSIGRRQLEKPTAVHTYTVHTPWNARSNYLTELAKQQDEF